MGSQHNYMHTLLPKTEGWHGLFANSYFRLPKSYLHWEATAPVRQQPHHNWKYTNYPDQARQMKLLCTLVIGRLKVTVENYRWKTIFMSLYHCPIVCTSAIYSLPSRRDSSHVICALCKQANAGYPSFYFSQCAHRKHFERKRENAGKGTLWNTWGNTCVL